MVHETDVLVVGGGATGTGLARDLSLRGLDVTLAERGGLSSGTSGRSHGLLHSGARYAEDDAVGATECIEENRILTSIAGECVRESGGLFVQLEADDPAYFDEKLEACESIGIPVEAVDGDEARDVVPGLSASVERAMRVPDAVVYPSRLVAANAVDARDNGATILTATPVEDVSVVDGRVATVSVGGRFEDEIEPTYVVNAAGAWAGRIAEMAGVSVDVRPTRGVMVAVAHEGLEPVLNRAREPADGDIVVPHEDEVVLGTTSVEVDDPDDYPTESWEVERTVEECAAMLPAVGDADVLRTWWGVRPLYGADEAERGGRGISRGFFLIDHAERGSSPDGRTVENLASVVGGKLTTYRRMAETTADLVCDRLGVDAPCLTAERRLPGADDPDRLDEFVATFDGQGPSDAHLGGPVTHED